MQKLGWKVLRVQENRVSWPRLVTDVQRYGCQALLWTRTWDVDHEQAFAALDRLRALGLPTASFHLDRWWGLDREYQIASSPFFRTGIVFTADGGHDAEWKAAGVEHRWSPPAVSEFDCAPHRAEPERWPWPVVFVGSFPYPHREWHDYRARVVETVRGVVGDDFAVLPQKGMGAIRERRLRSLYATADIVIGDSCLVGGVRSYCSDRIPETLGRGGFLIHPRVEGITDGTVWKDGAHLAGYDLGDFGELAELVAHYRGAVEERREIAAEGRRHTLAHHTYTHRMAVVLNEMGLA